MEYFQQEKNFAEAQQMQLNMLNCPNDSTLQVNRPVGDGSSVANKKKQVTRVY